MQKVSKKAMIISITSITAALLLIALVVSIVLPQYWGYFSRGEQAPLFEKARHDLLTTFDEVDLSTRKAPKRVINNEKPLNLVNYYFSEPVDLFWNSIPESQRELSVLLIIPSHVYLPTDEEALRRMEETADECERLRIPYAIQNAMGEAFMEELMPLAYLEQRFMAQHEYFYGLNCAELYNGIEWRGETDSDLSLYVSDGIKLCAKYGALFIWTDTNMRYKNGMMIEWLERSEEFYSTLKNYSQYVYVLSKETSVTWMDPMPMPSSYSLLEGLWLSGLIAGWGVACDWWSFAINAENDAASLFHENDNLIDHYSENGFSYPENLFTMNFAYVMSRGGTCFKAEAPNMTMTIGGKPVAGFQYSMMPFLDSLINGRLQIPSRDEVMRDTTAVVVGAKNFPDFNYNKKESYRFPDSGTINIIPLLPKNLRLTERAVFESNGVQIIEKKLSEKQYNKIFAPIDANTYATRTADQWYYINNVDNISMKKQAKLYPIYAKAEYFTIDASEHTFAIIKEAKNSLKFNINNYRTDKKALLEGVTSATDNSWEKISAEYLILDDYGNPILDDTVKRNSTITIKGTYQGGKPQIVFLNSSDGSGAFNRPYIETQTWNSATQVLTISIEHNGKVDFDVLLDSADGNLNIPVKEAIASTKGKNNNSVDKLSELVKSPITDKHNYTYYSYLQYSNALSRAEMMISERTYSKSQINKAASELKKYRSRLIRVDKYVSTMKEVLEIDKSQYSEDKYNNLMTAYDLMLLELLSPKYFVEGKANRALLYVPDVYRNVTFNAFQNYLKKNALERRYNALTNAIAELKS